MAYISKKEMNRKAIENYHAENRKREANAKQGKYLAPLFAFFTTFTLGSAASAALLPVIAVSLFFVVPLVIAIGGPLWHIFWATGFVPGMLKWFVQIVLVYGGIAALLVIIIKKWMNR